MGGKLIKFLKHLSITRKVMLSCITLLVIGYIFCLPRQLFHVPYSTVVTDRNGELLGARIASDGQWRFPPRATTPEKSSLGSESVIYRKSVLSKYKKQTRSKWRKYSYHANNPVSQKQITHRQRKAY